MQIEPPPIVSDALIEGEAILNLLRQHRDEWTERAEQWAVESTTEKGLTAMFIRMRARNALKFAARCQVMIQRRQLGI